MTAIATRRVATAILAALALLALAVGPTPAAASRRAGTGAVYTMSNAAGGNSVIVFRRAGNGSLSFSGEFATTGLGTGSGLGNQGGLIRDGRRLFAVDAGSNEITMFRIGSDNVTLTHLDTVASGGVKPISLTTRGRLLYALNGGSPGSAPNITGFRVSRDEVRPIVGSTRPLSSPTADPAQIQFARGRPLLIVTEKNTNLIDTYTVDRSGMATGPTTHPSNGMTPFGFALRGNELIVSEAFGGAADASALSSYRIRSDGSLAVISGTVPTTETAACWVVVTGNGKFAYTTNTGSNSISGYAVARSGALTLLDGDGVTASTGAGPIDMALSRGSAFLYSLDGGGQGISAFDVEKDGSLTPLPGVTGLPAGVNGLVAR
jgi:6-phosphogluconolactonase